MLLFELTLLTITYTSLIIAIFLQILCYKRNIENIETIAFTGSLLLLIVSISLSPLFPEEKTTTSFTLVCMVLVSSTTFLNTLSERKHSIDSIYKKLHLCFASALAVLVVLSFWLGHLLYIQYAIVVFLIFSIVVSMLITRVTKPIRRFAHLERSNRVFAIAFLTLVPIYLVVHYGFEKHYEQFQFGFLLYMAFASLAISKIYDDLHRLSLINKSTEPKKQHFKNYGLTEREEEIADLLAKGITYQNISEQLFISLPTVKTHASNIYKKCGVKTRHELTHLLTH